VSNGFVVLHRSIQEHPRYRRGHWFRIFADMEMEAAHRGYKKEFDGKIVFVKPGQLITDRVSLGEKLGIQPSAIERIWAQMKDDGEISWEARRGSKGRLFTMHGYAERQCRKNRTAKSIGKSEPNRTANEQRTNSERTAIIGAQQWNNDNKGNNDDDKAMGSSLAGEQSTATGKSSSLFFSNLEEAMKHPRWKEFDAYCKGSPVLKGFNTWLPQQAPLNPEVEKPKRPCPMIDYEAAIKASEAKADKENAA
jgi:hypothetical protein